MNAQGSIYRLAAVVMGAVILGVLVSSCVEQLPEKEGPKDDFRIEVSHYGGHEYLRPDVGYSEARVGMIHSESCPCKSK